MLKEDVIDRITSVGIRPTIEFNRSQNRFLNFYEPQEDSVSKLVELNVRREMGEVLLDVDPGTHVDDPHLEALRCLFITRENNAFQRGADESFKQLCRAHLREVCEIKRSQGNPNQILDETQLHGWRARRSAKNKKRNMAS